MALMLTNRPEFHWFDSAAMHLGATPFSLYNTYTVEQIQYQVDDAGGAHRGHRARLCRAGAKRSPGWST